MNTQKLITILRDGDPILPRDLLAVYDEDTLIDMVAEIFEKHQDLLSQDKLLQKNYIELVNYLYTLKLKKRTSGQKTRIFKDSLIRGVLSLPEPA